MLKVGDTIVVRINNRYADEYVVVESIEDDIKNGESGWDGYYVDITGKPLAEEFSYPGSDGKRRVWGYMDQIIRKVVR